MKSNREIRDEAWQLLFSGGWLCRCVVLGVAFSLVAWAFACLMSWVLGSSDLGTFQDFLVAQQMAASQGLAYAPSHNGDLMRMLGASLFQNFLQYLLSGILFFGATAVSLMAVRNTTSGWLRTALSGFASPFTQFWLMFGLQIRTALWLCASMLPAGVIAGALGSVSLFATVSLATLTVVGTALAVATWLAYRYLLTWFLHVDHPDWSAGRCISESIVLMKGWKMRAFQLDCSYWPSFLPMLPLLGAVLFLLARVWSVGLPELGGVELVAGAVIGTVSVLYALFLVCYVSLGHVVFYRERMLTSDAGPVGQ